MSQVISGISLAKATIRDRRSPHVMPGFMPGIHDLTQQKLKDVDGRDMGEQSDAVLRTAMPGHDGIES